MAFVVELYPGRFPNSNCNILISLTASDLRFLNYLVLKHVYHSSA